MEDNKTKQNEVKRKRKSIVRTDRVRDYSCTDKLLKNEEFINRLLAAINNHYLDEK